MAAPSYPDLADSAGLDRHRVIAEARAWIGTSYRHQASLKGVGCDCLGLIRGVWRNLLGAEPQKVPAYSADWAEAAGRETFAEAGKRWLTEVAVDAMNPGDVLLFRWRDGVPAKHAGILSDRAALIHAYEKVGVVETPLVPAWRRRIAHVFAFPGVLPWQP